MIGYSTVRLQHIVHFALDLSFCASRLNRLAITVLNVCVFTPLLCVTKLCLVGLWLTWNSINSLHGR